MREEVLGALRLTYEGALMLLCPTRARCMGCGSLLGTEEGWLCPECEAQLKPLNVLGGARCPRCGMPLNARGKCDTCGKWPEGQISFARCAYLYGPPVRGMIRALKYDGVALIAPRLAQSLHDLMIYECFDRPDAIISVPMHKRRLRERGLDHARLLAGELGKRANLPVWDGRLTRVINTPQQARRSGERRRKSLANAFRARDVEGARILLVDDVLTTGATALACAGALRLAGARDVQLIAVAGAGKKR